MDNLKQNDLPGDRASEVPLNQETKLDLQALKAEFTALKEQEQKTSTDVAFAQLTDKISALFTHEESLRAWLDQKPELVELMRQVVKNARDPERLDWKVFDTQTEKRLLMSLMYRVLADLGKKQA